MNLCTEWLKNTQKIPPYQSINQSGELSVNNANINRVKYVNDNYTISLEDAILLGDASTSNINITLPNAAQNKGKRLIIKKKTVTKIIMLR